MPLRLENRYDTLYHQPSGPEKTFFAAYEALVITKVKIHIQI